MDDLSTVVRVAAGGKDRLNAMYMVDAEAATLQVAMRHGVPGEEVRRQIQLAMLNGLVNNQMGNIPSEGDIPNWCCEGLACP